MPTLMNETQALSYICFHDNFEKTSLFNVIVLKVGIGIEMWTRPSASQEKSSGFFCFLSESQLVPITIHPMALKLSTLIPCRHHKLPEGNRGVAGCSQCLELLTTPPGGQR